MTTIEIVLLILVILGFLGLAFAFRAIELQRQQLEKQGQVLKGIRSEFSELEERVAVLEQPPRHESDSPLARLPIVGGLLTQKNDVISLVGLLAWRVLTSYLKRRTTAKPSQDND